MKTLQELNSRVWYRAVKVLFILFYIVCVTLAGVAVYVQNEPYKSFDQEHSYVACDDGRQLSIVKNNIDFLSEYDVLYGEEDRRVRTLCAYDPNDPININPDNPADIARLNPNYKNYKLVPAYTALNDYGLFQRSGYAALAVLAVILVLELIRRLFYYIVVGKLIPPRKEQL